MNAVEYVTSTYPYLSTPAAPAELFFCPSARDTVSFHSLEACFQQPRSRLYIVSDVLSGTVGVATGGSVSQRQDSAELLQVARDSRHHSTRSGSVAGISSTRIK